MNRAEWMATLAPLIRPRAPLPCATQLGKLLPFVSDIPDRVFTEPSLAFIAPKLPRTPSLGQLRDALNAYLRTLDGPPDRAAPDSETMRERRRQAERDDALREDWDDPAGIRASIRTCNGEMKYLRMLAALVHRHAPQHLGLLPPDAIASLDEPAPEPGRFAAPAPPRPAYFTPEQLKAVGVTHGRTAERNAPPAEPDDTAAAEPVATTSAASGAYPARDDA